MAAPLPLSDQITVKEQLLSMGFNALHIDEALQTFQQTYGDDYKLSTVTEIILKIKNKQTQITQQISHHNKQTIGTELYYKIYSIEPTLAGKITGMLLQWNTSKLMNLLNNPSKLQQSIKNAKLALDNVPFQAHMDLATAQNLRVADNIDFRNTSGYYIQATVVQKTNSLLGIEYYDKICHCNRPDWADYTKELYRFAVSGSVTARPAHRLQQLSVGDMVDVKPSLTGWTYGKITNIDHYCGQIEIMYEIHGISFVYWTHRDNIDEVSVFGTKYEYVHISMDLLNWKALATHPNGGCNLIQNAKNVKNVLLLNNNEIVVINERKIYKYIITSNRWVVWFIFPHDVTVNICCCDERKTVLYILLTQPQNFDLINKIMRIDLLTKKSTVYNIPFPMVTEAMAMVMVDDVLHCFGVCRYNGNGLHFIWSPELKELKNGHIFDNLPIQMNQFTNSIELNTAFIYCKHRNILCLFGRRFGNKIFVYSLKQNKWFSKILANSLESNPFDTWFGFALTNDEKYMMIFPGSKICFMMETYAQIGKILLLDLTNITNPSKYAYVQLIDCKNHNFLLRNVTNLMPSQTQYSTDEYQLFYPIIVNKTTILIDGYLKHCWQMNGLQGMRLLSEDVMCMIKRWYGYDNDGLYIYCAYGGFLWNTKVNEIIKNEIPKLKFCADYKLLQQEQYKNTIIKNSLLKKHSQLTSQIHQQHQQYQQQHYQPLLQYHQRHGCNSHM